jgi:gamma-glutamyltranspeptidase/glutathione hydrolase
MRSRLGPLLAVAGVATALALPAGVAAKPRHHHPPAPPGGPYHHVPNATATGSGGAAASVDSVATNAAIDALRRGGNAVDAAVTAAGVLGVTEPFSCGIGGGGFMLIRTPHGRVTSIDGRETAPAEMQTDSFFENGTALSMADARWSGLSAGVPGTVATWEKALRRYGTWRLGRALQAGIHVARKGFVVDQTFFNQAQGPITTASPKGETADYFDDIPSTASIYLDADGTPHDVGTVQRNPDLARTYEILARFGARAFYHGPIARAMAEAAQNPPKAPTANHAWRPGLLEKSDLARYDAIRRAPTHVNYRGLDVWGMGPPSSGGSTVGEVLNILEGYDLRPDRTKAYHLFLEASRLAYADRGSYLADPAYFDVPLQGLLSDSFAAERRALITDQAKNAPVPPGDPYDDQQGGAAPHVSATHDRVDGRSTTHLTVADRDGMVVTYTFTIEATGGNGIVVPGYGFLLNNELTDFNYSDPTAANKPEGGKRPRSSMSPTIVTAGRRPVLALGSPGGATIITTVLEILLERIDFGTPLPDAIAAPRASQRNDTTSEAESAFTASPLGQALQAAPYLHAFRPVSATAVPAGEIGAATGIEFGRHRLLAAAEPSRRGGGAAMVVRPR